MRSRLSAVLTMAVLAGTPAMPAVCAYVCAPAGATGAAHPGGQPDSLPGAAVAPADGHAHDHHHLEAPGSTLSPADAEPLARLADGNCCAHDGRALPSMRAAVRFGTYWIMAVSTSALGAPAPLLRVDAASRSARRPDPPIVRSATADVLRI